MKRDLRSIFISLLFVSLFSVFSLSAFGQETTGSIDITVKDTAAAVVPNVPVTVTGISTGFKRTVTTDDAGFYRLLHVPPGSYRITTAAVSGFVEKTIDKVEVGLGRTTSVTIELSTEIGVTVNVTGEATGIDVQSTKIQDTISSETADLIPRGQNFSTVLKFSAATRPEPRSGQYQIDGASGSENTFIVDGQEVTDVLTGALDRNSNLPFSIVQEVQVKTSGFEAEFGGATGGVINVVTKSGSNELRGEFGVNLRTSRLEPIPGNILLTQFGSPEWLSSRRYQYNQTDPTAALQGPIWKDKVWFSVAYAPQIFTADRELQYRNATTRELNGRVEHYYQKIKAEKVFGRFDAQPFSRLNVNTTFQWNPETTRGAIPGYSSEFNTPPAQAGNPTFNGAAFLNQTGGRLNSLNFTTGGSYLITNSLIATARYGHYFLNNKLGTIGYGDVTAIRVNCANSPLSTAQFPANFGCVRGGNNGVTPFGASLYDATTRDQLDADATYSFGLFGRHELKAGFQDNTVGNIVQQQNTDILTLRWGTTGAAKIGAHSGISAIPSSPNATGSGFLSITQTEGDVSSKNTAIYVQDRWLPTNRLTLNLGLRVEREDVPSYARGLPGLNFSFGSKIAPRLGAAYDLTGDGKTKVSFFYGLFYDRFKLTLPRLSFGGDQFHKLYFELFAGDTLASLTRENILGAGNLPIAGGACPPTNTTTPVYGRVRCDIDERISSNVPGAVLEEVGGVDPNIKPFQQREITFTFERQLFRSYRAGARYTRKQVVRTIEDAGFPNATTGSTVYITGNPGEGLYKDFVENLGLLAPKAQRQYDALELRFDKAYTDRYFFSMNYTFSRLYGNYGGLASSDEEGRLDPNVNRYFDEPAAGYTVAGGPDNGRLPTDRPHVFKAYGGYTLGWEQFGLWKSNATDFLAFTTVSSGSVITSFANIRGVEQIILTKRGDQGRTPVFSQTDFAVRHNIKFGRDGRFTLKLEADAINVFNQYTLINKGRNPSGQGGNIISTTNFDVLDPQWGLITQARLDQCGSQRGPCYAEAFRNFQQNGSPQILASINAGTNRNPYYNVPVSYQGKRTIRYGLRLVF